MPKIGRNTACPCGSGKKYKKCCLVRDEQRRFTAHDRECAKVSLERLLDERHLELEHDRAWDDLLPEVEEGELDHADRNLDELYDPWFAFDRTTSTGDRIVDRLLSGPKLSRGERAWLRASRETRLGLYEVSGIAPGRGLTLRDVLTDRQVQVTERTASRTVNRFDLLATRIMPSPRIGEWELDHGALAFPARLKADMVAYLARMRVEHEREPLELGPDGFERSLPVFVAELYRVLANAPPPVVKTPEGHEVVPSKVHFRVLEAGGLRLALEASPDLERAEGEADTWSWSEGEGGRLLGSVCLYGDRRLVLETFTREGAEDGRRLLAQAAGEHIEHLMTEHSDLSRAAAEWDADEDGGLDPEVEQEVLASFYEQHYREWLDEPVPALDGATPRAASASEALRPRLLDLLREGDNLYHRSLALGTPGYEPTMLWRELGLEHLREARPPSGTDPAAPGRLPPLAHEVLEEQVPGTGIAARQASARFLEQAGTGGIDTVSMTDLHDDLPSMRFLQEHGRSLVAGGVSAEEAADDANLLGTHLHLLVNWELHHRKLFQVSDAVAWMLDKTQLDLPGDQLRLPFPAFALLFADRHTLSVAERLLTRDRTSPLSGQLLELATVYVVREGTGPTWGLRLGFAFHAGGDDWPYLVARDLWVGAGSSIEEVVDSRHPESPEHEPGSFFTAPELRRLVRLVLNAILFATSSRSKPERRPLLSRPGTTSAGPAPVPSDEVYFLPGHIDIRHVQQLQEVERGRDGAGLMHRFMVRGHWRRANPTWKDQRPRWIEPYWKGPELAAIIERRYRLRGDD